MPRECPICALVCESFEPGGSGNRRPDAMCPGCGSLERQRLAWLYLRTETDLFSRAERTRLLHVSPDRSLVRRLGEPPRVEQVTADVDPARAAVQMDITNIQYPDGSFDVIYCSHVLEHVIDDRLALRELCRVLAPDGWVLIQVPVGREVTDEDPSLQDLHQRALRFGQFDHLRLYGRDFPERVAGEGFEVTVDPYPRRIGRARSERFGLTLREEIFVARMPEGNGAGSGCYPVDELVRGDRSVDGRIEMVKDRVVTGWAWMSAEPGARVTVRALLDGVEVGDAIADLERPSLAAAGIGDGRHAFRVPLWQPASDPGPHRLRVVAQGLTLPPAQGFSTTPVEPLDPWYAVDVTDPRESASTRDP